MSEVSKGQSQQAGRGRLLGPGLAIGAAISFALSVPLGKWLLGAFLLVILATALMVTERHIHEHKHGEIVHSHSHWPDQEHRHTH